jgi:dolichyl-phosphate beta-glucosyltransferase
MAGLKMDLSVVLPVYNGASFVASSVAALAEFLSRQRFSWEIVLVDDGSTDGTESLVPGGPRMTVVRLPANRGKFAAVKAGMAAATGRCRIFTDADVPYDLEALPYVESLVNTRGFHVVVGDRALTESIYGKRLTRSRAAASRGFSFLVRMLVTGGLFDTQCGLKGFRGDVADALFPLLTVEGFAGDVELLYVALKYNLEIRRIPVRLRKSETSTIRFAWHAPLMLGNALRLRGKWVDGRYESAALRALAAQAYWPAPDAPPPEASPGSGTIEEA